MGLVLGEAKESVPGTTLEVHEQNWRFLGETTTRAGKADAKGYFRLPVPRDTPFRLWAVGPEKKTASLAPVFAGDTVVVELKAGRTFRVHTIQKASQEPLSGVDVSIWYAPDRGGATLFDASAVSDADGLAVIPNVPEGDVSVEGHTPGLCTEDSWVSMTEEKPVDVVLSFRTGVQISGHVFDRSTGLGVSGVRVGDSRPWQDTSAPDGAYCLPPIRTGVQTLRLKAIHPSYAPHTEYLKVPAEEGEMKRDFFLDPASAATGQILDESKQPVSGAQVVVLGMYSSGAFSAELQRLERTTDATGRFSLSGLASDVNYFLFAHFEKRQGAGFVRSPAPGKTVEVEPIILQGSSEIRGHVLFSDKEERPSIELYLSLIAPERFAPSNRFQIGNTDVSPDGTFAFHDLPSGTFQVMMQAEGATSQEALYKVIQLPAKTVSRDLVFDLGPNRQSTIEGRVTNESGGSAGQVEVLVLDGTRILSSHTTSTGGSFSFDLEGAGPWTIRVVDRNAFYEKTEVSGILPQSGEVNILLHELHTAFALDGHLLDEEGNPVVDAYVELKDQKTGALASRLGIPAEDGYFRVPNLEDKAYDLEIVDYEGIYQPLRIQDVVPGKPLELTLQRRR